MKQPSSVKVTLAVIIFGLSLLLPVPALAQETVVLLHGLASIPLSMKYLEGSFEEEGFRVHNIGYPSTDLPIEEAANLVREKVLALEPAGTIHFVGHSLGNIIIRKMLEKKVPNLGRIVMIAPPNQGSLTAQRLRDLDIYRWFFGPAGQELSADRENFFKVLPIPSCQFGIIAGGLGTKEGYNPLLPGDDDGTVRVEETMLPGAADFILINSTHTLILFEEETARQTIHFLKTGTFQRGESSPKKPPEGRITLLNLSEKESFE